MVRPRPTDADIRRRNATRTLKTLCWCKCQELNVPAVEVRAGRTFSCGRIMCDALGFTNALTAGGDPCDCDERKS